MKYRPLGFLILAWLSPHHLQPVQAQDPVRIPKDLACPRCSVRLERIGSIEPLGTPIAVALDGRGRMFVTSRETPQEIEVFGADGQRLPPLGQAGEGPGEYRRISALLIGRGDSLYVFDAQTRRLSILDPDLRFLRSAPITGEVLQAVQLDAGLVFSGAVRTEASIGFPLHLLGPEGSIERSFGSTNPVYQANRPWEILRYIAPSGQDRVWSAHLSRYEIELWDARGELLKTFIRDVEWFRPYDRPTPITEDIAPQPQVTSLMEDEGGRLWITVRLGDGGWRRGLKGTRHTSEGPVPIRGSYEDLFDTRIEVLDPAACHVIVSEVVPQFVTFLRPGLLLAFREGPNAVPVLELWRVSLASPTERR